MDTIPQKPAVDDKRWKLIYPLYYSDYINKFSGITGLDPFLVTALVREESYFNTDAVSSSNAQGLMQILPGTASDIARWKNFGNAHYNRIFEAETNLKYGTAYLSYIKERLQNNDMFAIAGYNGGPGAVEKWTKSLNYSDMDEFVENIPYEQSRNYVKKVYRSYWNYKRIYD